VPATLLALLHKQPAAHRKAAALSIFSGFFVNVVLFALGMLKPEIIEPKVSFVPAMVVAFLTLGAGLLFRKKTVY
jgi:fatty acid desaturase